MAGERINHQWRLASRPAGRIRQDNFTWHEEPMPVPGEGQVIVRVVHLSLDPTQRVWASDMPQYMPPVEIGEVMRGGGIGIVEESRSADLAPGDLVSGLVGWQEYTLVDERVPLSRITPAPGVPLTAYLGLFSHIGATAYFGLTDVAAAPSWRDGRCHGGSRCRWLDCRSDREGQGLPRRRSRRFRREVSLDHR